ncbi:MAG: septation regulator SpoVG [Elusimicrobia bacterium]|nr:septation regulator SpoVG [Candidatus Liberimonas magnetica]
MKITEVRIFLKDEQKLKAYAAVTFDDVFVVHNLRIVKGEKGLMVCMPSRKMNDGTFKDIAHPITNDFRHDLEKKVLEFYEEKLKSNPDPGQHTNEVKPQ